MKRSKIRLILAVLLSGLLLSFAWPEHGFAGLLFIALVPLLFAEDFISRHREQFGKFAVLFYSYPAFFVWNMLTTWWIVNSTLMGAVMAIVLNSLFMAIVFQVWSWAKRRLLTRLAGYVALLSFWMAFEYLHLNWILAWPWLNLGNGFAAYHKWIQWYEYTGAMGGTLWVLVGNIIVFESIKAAESEKRKMKISLPRCFISRYFLILFLWIGLPITISYIIYGSYREKSDPVHFVVVQPNLDPYSEQYSLPPRTVIGKIMDLAGPLLDTTTNFLVAPESAIQESMWEDDVGSFVSIPLLKSVLQQYPELNILIGGSTFKEFLPGEPLSRSARKFSRSEGYYDAFNTAILINSSDSLQLYHKSKLTPGVEALPSFHGFKWLENFALDLGGTVGSLGTDPLRKVYSTTATVPVSPAICYESVFGEFFATFVKNGAQVMIIITNDGWWGETPGYRQHFAFSRLRAIETRRCIARSANTGISAFINQRGDATDVTRYWFPAAIRGTLNANRDNTFYVRHGDYLARIATGLTAILLIIAFIVHIFGRRLRGTWGGQFLLCTFAVQLTVILILYSGCNQPGKGPSVKAKPKPFVAADIPVFNADTAYAYVKAQVDFGPRVNNSKAHDRCGEYLAKLLKKTTPEVVSQQGVAEAFDGTPLRFRNLIASYGPPGNNRILLGAHWDSRPFADHDPDPARQNQWIDGANDGASGVGVLLEVARHLARKTPPVGVDIIFFDAEDYGPPESLQTSRSTGDEWGLGSQYWAKNPHRPDYYARYGILLDMVGAADATFLMEGISMEYAPDIVRKVWDYGNQIGYSAYFLYQRGGYVTDDHYYVIRDRHIPMIDIIHLDPLTPNGMYKHWHTVDDNLEKIAPNTLKAVGQTLLTVIYSEK